MRATIIAMVAALAGACSGQIYATSLLTLLMGLCLVEACKRSSAIIVEEVVVPAGFHGWVEIAQDDPTCPQVETHGRRLESFFSTLKFELGKKFDIVRSAKEELFDYIEVFYNQERRHSALGYVSPAGFEKAARNVRAVG
jgi:hypothetical protein